MVDLLAKAEEVAKSLGMKEDGTTERPKEPKEEPKGETEEVEDETTQETTQEEEEIEEDTGPPKSIPYKRFAEVYGRYKELERLTTALLAEKQKEPSREAPKAELPDFDTMTQGEVAKWTLGAVAQLIDQKLSQTVGPMQESAAVKDAMVDIEKTASKHKDFWNHYETMHSLSLKHPSLSAEQLYLLASGNRKDLARVVTQDLKDRVAQKKAARTEMRSTSSGKQTEVKTYKNTREAALDIAKKLGMT